MILCQDVRIDLYLYQVSFSWEMKITWKLVRNPLYSIYLSQIHCKDVWQFPKWIMSSGVLSAPPTSATEQTRCEQVAQGQRRRAKYRADLPLPKWHTVLILGWCIAVFPQAVTKSSFTVPPLEQGSPVLGREYKTQGTLCWVIFIPVILNTGEAEPSVSRFSSSFFPPSHLLRLGRMCLLLWSLLKHKHILLK